MKNTDKLKTEAPAKLLWSLSVPAMIGLFVMALYNIVDMIFIAYAEGTDAVAGLIIAFPVMMFMMAIANAIGIGAASVISRRLGEDDSDAVNKVFGTFLFLIVLISIFSVVLAIFLDEILALFGATDIVTSYAYDYMLPILLGFLFIGFSMASNSILRAEGSANIAMKATVLPAVINIILDPIFIFDFGMGLGVRGAGIATVVAQGVVSVLVFLYYYFGNSSITFILNNVRMRLTLAREIIAIGLPNFVHMAASSVMMVAINVMLLRYGGDIYLAVFGVIHRIIGFAVMPMMGVMQGMLPIVGYNYGAKMLERVRAAIRLSLKFVVWYSVAVVVVIMLLAEHAISIFTNDIEFIEIGSKSMKIMFACFFVVGVQFIVGGIYQAIGKPRPAMVLTFSRQVLFLIPMIIVLPSFFGVNGVFLAFPIADVMALVLALYMIFRDREIKGLIIVRGKNNIN